ELDLEWFAQNPQTPDVLGLDYYPHSDWQLVRVSEGIRQRRADKPIGLYGIASAYWQRYGIPLMLTETSIEGQEINREIWLESVIDDARRLREEGIPMLGLIWWPMIDQVDWDGALTHRIGKIHEVGLFNLKRQPDGALARSASPLVEMFKKYANGNEEFVGKLEFVSYPLFGASEEQLPPIGQWAQPANDETESANQDSTIQTSEDSIHKIDRFGIVVFCHLRWGFVWQRPQQFLSRFARKHPILFIEEPVFDQPEGAEPDVQCHRVMPNVTVVCPHVSASWNRNPKLPEKLRQWTQQAIERMNDNGEFDNPLLWYYSPMDASWSLGYIPNRGIVYDCMDELANFSGAPKALIENEKRLMEYADVIFTGGYEMGEKRKKVHPNVHIFGCGVEFKHFNKAQDKSISIPPDIDFMARPILGWFGVIDERVDYGMIGEMARKRPEWSFAMIGPVVKVDPNLLPHSPNLFWMGGRDYQQLPNYCAAFDICMMPFANNASTQYINPTKGLEYMATGKPIISTPVRDVVRQWAGIVYIAKNADEFIAAAQKVLENPDQDRIGKGLELAKKSSWESTVAAMQDHIRTAIGDPGRRSGRKIEPMSASELEYQYRATPGS
ncbi:MAG TPA: glycosyltransferase, partial [Tepidisphaeraceae bacterium]|nr:glycosyltransferase [Tepidisphaeraceae bacterium]